MYPIFQLGKQIQYCDPNYLEKNFVGVKCSETFAQISGEVDQIG
jgi:hypothetical protein